MKSTIWLSLLAALTSMGPMAHAEVPAWLKPTSKIMAFEEFIEGMRYQEFYKITDSATTQIKDSSGQDSIRVQITFDDDKGCKGRVQVSSCTVLYDKEAICSNALSYCDATFRNPQAAFTTRITHRRKI